MKIRNWKIGIWLISGFTIILTFVVFLGITSYVQTKELSNQTEIMYEHPLAVRRSIDHLRIEMYELRLQIRNLILAETEEEKQDAITLMELALLDAEQQFEDIEAQYLGPKEDVQETYTAFVLWSNVREDNMQLIESGELDTVLESISENGQEALLRDTLLEKIDVIDTYAQNKSDELYNTSIALSEQMAFQLVIIVSSLFILTLLIGLSLYQSFRIPLTKMNETILQFKEGNMTNRIMLNSTNELGILANSIDEMADTIESSERLHSKTNQFSDVIISENEYSKFFTLILQSLMNYTDSIGSAIYILDEDKNLYSCYESIGFQKDKLNSYNPKNLEGEFGNVLLTKEIQTTSLGKENQTFVYNTVSMGVIPKEILSIPLISNDTVTAIITLATLDSYDEETLEFLERIMDNLTSRTEAIFATEKADKFLLELEQRSNELVAQNAELEMQKKQLNEASKLKSNFLSNMSHELRTPLNSVIALSGVLYDRLKGKISEDEYSYLEIIGRNGKNLLELINDILDISRIESGKVEVEITKFGVNTLVKEVLNMFHMQAEQKGIELKHINSSSSIQIDSDYDKLKHIIQNLVSNAVKFTEKGFVSIEVESINSHLEIIVTDSGIGIEDKHLDVIFEEFKQAESGTSRRFGGTGLGLSIARRFTELLDGKIDVSSKLNIGSTFRVVLPRKYKGSTINTNGTFEVILPEITNVEQPVDLSNSTYEKTVLLIEDNESAIIQVRELVEGMGVNIEVAENGEKGLEMLGQLQVDAIILDLMMPGIDGFEVLTQIRNSDKTSHMPVLILTAKHITKKDLGVLKRNNIHQIVQKGDIDRIELQTTIFNMLYNRKKIKTKTISKSKKPRILVVEDNEDNRVTIHAILNEFGELYEATDGKEGIEMAVKLKPDLILMDIALPKVSGIEAFHAIKKSKGLEVVPIIAITASALADEKEMILAHGFDAFVAKPLKAEILLSTIEKVIYND